MAGYLPDRIPTIKRGRKNIPINGTERNHTGGMERGKFLGSKNKNITLPNCKKRETYQKEIKYCLCDIELVLFLPVFMFTAFCLARSGKRAEQEIWPHCNNKSGAPRKHRAGLCQLFWGVKQNIFTHKSRRLIKSQNIKQ